MVRRKTESIRAGRAAKTDDRGSGQAVEWYDRAPPDEEFEARSRQLEEHGVDVQTGYWQAGDWFGVRVDPLGAFATNSPEPLALDCGVNGHPPLVRYHERVGGHSFVREGRPRRLYLLL